MRPWPNILILMVDQLNGTLFPDGSGRLAARAEPEGACRALGALRQRLHRLAAVRAGRASFMSGQLPRRTRVYDNAAEFASDIPTYAHHLRRAGYQTCLSGKMHFVGPDQLHGFEERLTTDIYPADFGWTPDYRKPGERIDWWYHNLGSVTGAGVAEISNQMEYDDEVAYHATQKLYDLSRTAGKDDRPWCADGQLHPSARPLRRPQAILGSLRGLPHLRPRVPPIPYEDHGPHSQRIFDANDWRSASTSPKTIAALAPRLFRQHLLSRRQDRRDPGDAGAHPAADNTIVCSLRPWRHAGRARPVVQDELLRGLGARAADDRRPGGKAGQFEPTSNIDMYPDAGCARRRIAGGRGGALDRRRKPRLRPWMAARAQRRC
jgi:hypothetical protein